MIQVQRNVPRASLKPTEKKSLSDTSKHKLLKDKVADLELEVKVLDETIKAKETQKKRLLINLDRTEKSQHDIQLKLRELGKSRDIASKDLKTVQNRLREAIKEVDDKLQAKQFELTTVESEINSRKQYLDNQEQEISKALEEGNQKLLSIKYEVEDFERIKQVEENKIYDIKQELDRYQELADGFKEASKQEMGYHKAEVLTEEIKLKELNTKIDDSKLELQQISIEIELKLIILKEKEESLVARESALRIQKDDLDLRERRLNSYEQLYS